MFPDSIKKRTLIISKIKSIDHHFYWVGVTAILFLQLFKAFDGLTTHWLADQSDVVQHFMYWHSNFFYGVKMSPTNPIVYTFGPVAIFLLSFPSLLGFNPEIAHQALILTNTSGLLLLSWIMRKSREDRFIFIIFIFILMLTSNYWWTLTIFWINSLLVFFALLFICALIYYFKKPTLNNFLLFICASFLPLHVHSTPAFIAPIVLYVIVYHFIIFRNYEKLSLFTYLILFITFIPYLIGELYNDFRNTFAIFENLNNDNINNRYDGINGGINALDSLFYNYNINFSWFDTINYNSIDTWLAIFFIVNILGMISVYSSKYFALKWYSHFWRCFPLFILSHFIFFYITNTNIKSHHYLTFSTIIFSMSYALIIGFWIKKLHFNSITILVILLLFQVKLSNITREIPDWSYRKITNIIDEMGKDTDNICMLFNPRFEPYKGKYYNSLELLLLKYYEKNMIYKEDSEYCIYFKNNGINTPNILPNYGFYKEINDAYIYKKNDI